jgi:glyoxylase-like metal-dependent hydrolase (beta-lactamase superfamily II)
MSEVTMEIHALSTGTVQIKKAMERGRGAGPLRFASTLLDRRYTGELPIHAWLIEHPEGPILVDAGELAGARDMPIARFAIAPEQEIDRLLAERGVAPGDLRQVVLTHLHGDHINGLARLPGVPVLASAEALRGGRALRRIGVTATPIELDDGPFGAFARSAALTADGRVVAVPVPGHARGQIAVVVVEDDRHVLIGGDSAYTERQLIDQQPDGVSISARQARESMRTILEHARRHATVFLPSHDPASAARLAGRTAVAV